MGRERDGYRENLELLNIRFPDCDMLTIVQVMEVTGWHNRQTIRKYLGEYFTAGKTISKVFVARWMCGVGKSPQRKPKVPFVY